MIWIQLFPLLIKTFTTASTFCGKLIDKCKKDKEARWIVGIATALFVLCELASFFINYNESRTIIDNYEAGYSYNLQDLNAKITDLVEDYKKDTLYQSAFTSVTFVAAICIISLVFRFKNHMKNRLKYIISGVILLVYICGVIIPVSFTSTKICSFSVEPMYEVKSEPNYFIQDGEISGVKYSQEFTTVYDWEIELSENKKFDGYKMFLLTVEIAVALALVIVIDRSSNQGIDTSYYSTSEDDKTRKP